MTQTERKQREAVVPTCPLDQEGFLGNCDGCTQRVDCILLTILQRVERIEVSIEKLAY